MPSTGKVVILLSDKRSGSTLFQQEVCKHPQIQTVEYSSHTYLETHHWLKGAVLLGYKGYKGYGSKGNARTYLIDTIKGNIPEFNTPTDDKELIFKGWEVLCQKFATAVFFEKSPQILAHWDALELLLEWIRQTKFEVKIIGLVRNPISVQYSAYQLFHTNPQKRQFGWASTQSNLLRFKGYIADKDFLMLKYEDIIANPQMKFKEVCEFIGVAESISLGMSAHKQSLEKWKMDPYFNFQLDKSVKEVALNLGYTETELNNPPKPPPPLYYSLKKQYVGKFKLIKARVIDRFIKPILLKFNE